jgi:hypothetical protein
MIGRATLVRAPCPEVADLQRTERRGNVHHQAEAIARRPPRPVLQLGDDRMDGGASARAAAAAAARR